MMCCKAVTANLLVVVGIIIEPSTAIKNQRVILRHLFPIVNLPLQKPLVVRLYIPPSIASSFLLVC